MKNLLLLITLLLILNNANGQYTLNLKGKYIKKGRPVELLEIRRTDQGTGRAMVIINGKEDDINLKDLKDIEFDVHNSYEFWQNQAIKHDVYENLLRYGTQYDLRHDGEEDALKYLNQIEENSSVFDDSYLENYLYTILYKLYPGTLNDGRPGIVNFKIVKDVAPNAFIFPNGTLIITTGLLTTINSEDELVAVISHEVAHFVLDHSIKNINQAVKRQKSAEFWAALATGLAAATDIYAASKNPYYSPGALTYGTAVLSYTIASQITERLGMKYSRDQEKEADQCAVELMKFMKVDPTALSSTLSKIKQYCVLTGNYLALSGDGTHPALEERIKEIGVPKIFKSNSYDKMISFVTSFNAISEFNNRHFIACQSLVNRNINSGVPTEDDYLLKAMTNLCLFDNIEKNNEALELINKAKALNVAPNLNIFKQEALVYIRMGKTVEAVASLESYKGNIIDQYNKIENIKNEAIWRATKYYLNDERIWASKMIYKTKNM